MKLFFHVAILYILERHYHICFLYLERLHLSLSRDFPGGAVVKTLCFHCRVPAWGTKILHATWCDWKTKERFCINLKK